MLCDGIGSTIYDDVKLTTAAQELDFFLAKLKDCITKCVDVMRFHSSIAYRRPVTTSQPHQGILRDAGRGARRPRGRTAPALYSKRAVRPEGQPQAQRGGFVNIIKGVGQQGFGVLPYIQNRVGTFLIKCLRLCKLQQQA